MKKTLIVIGLLILKSHFLFAQTDSTVVQSVSDIKEIKTGDRKIVFPDSPKGYLLILKGSDHNPIIDESGRITTPLVATKVNLYFQLVSQANDTLKYDVSKQVTVPGKFSNGGTNGQPFVIPALREWHGGNGDFFLTASSRIVLNPADEKQLQSAADILKEDLKKQSGFNLPVVKGKAKKGDIFLTLSAADQSIGEEGYYFNTEEYITIIAIKYQGLFWGTRTLLQLLEQKKGIPKGLARDYPEFKVRGFVLDVGRKFFSLQFLKDYVKLMSYYKMNDFQIHLNDNGFKKYFNDNWADTYSAFRLENTTYPGLTAKDGSYTKKEFMDLQVLANQYAVQIIPEIDAPAHALAFTKVVPEIGSKAYGMDHLDLHNPLTYSVMEKVFKEYLSGSDPVFMGKTVHIGTDEYAKKDAEVFRAFTDHMIKYVEGFGKDVRLWGALTHAKGNTPVKVENVTMNTWYNGYANPVEMKKLGYKQISTPDGWLYIVPGAGYYFDYLDVKNIYNQWTPSMIGNVKFPAGDPTILGGSFAVWNDIVGNGYTEKDVNDRVFPAMQVLAQKMWAGTETALKFDDFNLLSKEIGEGPSLNMRGEITKNNVPFTTRFGFDGKDKRVRITNALYSKGYLQNALAFSGKNSIASLPYTEIGYNYTVSFWINPSNNLNDAVLFKSPNAVVKLKQAGTGKLGFSREGYDIDFGYTVPENTWTHVVITGTSKGTSLFINGKPEKRLIDNWIVFTDKDKTKMRKSETLFFPLQTVGGFKGKLDELQIWNKILSDEEISVLK
ncbi:family 20 glycosylhydrolase [Pedobacter nototheniae]|uniref:family 20 glycosylhydrolase n=1 Tax=Pedobacter nototheniae TaxID=2488994 RepID=UPI00292F39D6|nr:family 20 glycosylhydrolase [Pedobacter nototheniae]